MSTTRKTSRRRVRHAEVHSRRVASPWLAITFAFVASASFTTPASAGIAECDDLFADVTVQGDVETLYDSVTGCNSDREAAVVGPIDSSVVDIRSRVRIEPVSAVTDRLTLEHSYAISGSALADDAGAYAIASLRFFVSGTQLGSPPGYTRIRIAPTVSNDIPCSPNPDDCILTAATLLSTSGGFLLELDPLNGDQLITVAAEEEYLLVASLSSMAGLQGVQATSFVIEIEVPLAVPTLPAWGLPLLAVGLSCSAFAVLLHRRSPHYG